MAVPSTRATGEANCSPSTRGASILERSGFDTRTMGERELGMVNYRSDPRLANINSSFRNDSIGSVDIALHETMHMVEGDLLRGTTWRYIKDVARFGWSDEAQYNWRSYSDLYSASYNQISATGGGTYPVEAGFGRFAHDVINNLAACGAVCPRGTQNLDGSRSSLS